MIKEKTGILPNQKDNQNFSIDEYGNITGINDCKHYYVIENGISPQLFFDEKDHFYKVKCGTHIYPLFDEKYGMSRFKNQDGEIIGYDTRIPVKKGEEPIKFEKDGKQMLKFGPDHKYIMPYESQNGEVYTQMKYEQGGTINIAFHNEKPINLAQIRAKLGGRND